METLSGLRERKKLEAFDWAFQPGLDKAFVTELGGLEFARRKGDLVVTGKSGSGEVSERRERGACVAQPSANRAAPSAGCR